jgi:hypothetical protein
MDRVSSEIRYSDGFLLGAIRKLPSFAMTTTTTIERFAVALSRPLRIRNATN